MKKFLYLFLPLIISALCFLGETSLLKAQDNLTWYYVGLCDDHKYYYDKCITCGKNYPDSDIQAKVCLECDSDFIGCIKCPNRNVGYSTLREKRKKHPAYLCSACAVRDVCCKCGKYLGSGEVAVRDKRKVVERYTVQITIPGKKEEFMKYFNAANEAITKGDYQQALNYFRKCDEIIPNGTACQIGIALRGLKKEDEAVKYFDIAIKEEPNYAEPYYQKGLVLIGQSKFIEAEELLKKSIQFKIHDGNAYLMYAYLLESERKDYTQAITHYERGFDLSPTTSSFRGNLINLYQQIGKFDEALKHANVLCELLDNSVEALNTKAELLFNFNKWNDAIPIYEKLISMNPNNIYIAYYYLGLCQFQVKQFEDARDNWEKSIELDENKSPETYSCLAVCEMKLNNPDDSKIYCEETIKRINRESSFIYYNLACAYSLMDEKDKGLEFLEKALKTGQVNIAYMESDADLNNIRETKEFKKLITKYKAVNQPQPQKEIIEDNKIVDVEKIFNEGMSLTEKKQYKDAINRFSEVIKIDPKHNKAYIERAACYNFLKQYDNSLRDYNKAIEISPDAATYLKRGILYTNWKKWQEALLDFKKSFELEPGLGEKSILIDMCYDEIKKEKNANTDSGNEILREDFEDTDCIFEPDEKWRLINGEFVFSNPADKNSVSWVRHSQNYSDITLSVNAKWNGKAKNLGFGLVFGSSGNNFYAFVIAQDGHYKLTKWFNSEWSNLTPWKEITLTPSGFNNLKVNIAGKKIKCYLNSALLVDIEDESFQGGKVGICSNSKVSASFDDFVIYQ